jgi:hypothetical protein
LIEDIVGGREEKGRENENEVLAREDGMEFYTEDLVRRLL